jgi:hypothetical protein
MQQAKVATQAAMQCNEHKVHCAASIAMCLAKSFGKKVNALLVQCIKGTRVRSMGQA